MRTYLSFETPVADIDARLDELRAVAEKGDSPALADEIAKLEAKAEKALADLYANLTPWQKTQVARVQGRPRFSDYVNGFIAEFTPLAGDRYFGEDEAVVGGLGRFEGESVCVMGQKRATTPKAACATISAWPGRRATARRSGSCSSPIGSACRSLRWSTPPAPFPGSTPRSEVRRKRSPARPTRVSPWACPMSRSSSVRAAREARSPSPRATRC